MSIPDSLITAHQRGHLLLLWAGLPFTLPAEPPANPAQTAGAWLKRAADLPPPPLPLPQLPPLPLLSLEPSARLEQQFAAAGIPLPPVITRREVAAAGPPSLLKLGGDLTTRQGLILSRAGLRRLSDDPDKRYLLAEARRALGQNGCLLALGAEPARPDFRAWWPVLWPALGRPAAFALGDPAAAWPAGLTPLAVEFAALVEALAAFQPKGESLMADVENLQKIIASKRRRLQKLKEQEAIYGISTPPEVLIQIEDLEEELAHLQAELRSLPSDPAGDPAAPGPAQPASKYDINISGPVTGLTIGDGVQVTQNFGAETPPAVHDALARLEARLEGLSAQLAQGVDELKAGQRALYRRLEPAQQAEVAQILAAVQAGQLTQAEMQATLADLRRAMGLALDHALPLEADLRAAIADLTEAVESSLTLDQKLELSLPLAPLLLNYKIELGAGSELDLHALRDELQARWRKLLEKVGR